MAEATKDPNATPLDRIAALEAMVAQLHQLLYDSSFKDEAFRRLAIQEDKNFYTRYLECLPVYQKFIDETRRIKTLVKISEKIKAIKEFNAVKANIFTMYVDDTDLVAVVEATGELSEKTWNDIVKLPITNGAALKLNDIKGKPEEEKPN